MTKSTERKALAEATPENHPILDPDLLEFRTAKKIKHLIAKPMQDILKDKTIVHKFLLASMEGEQVLKTNSMVCIGNEDDAWQQEPATLLKKYNVTGYTDDGWAICEPKPENENWACQIPEDHPPFSVICLWGREFMVDGQQVFLLFGKPGDYVLRSKTDPNDVWIVDQKLFRSTYEIEGDD